MIRAHLIYELKGDTMTMNPVVHFEMPAENKKRMVKFYTETFGWKTIQTGPEMGNYTVVLTTESDDSGPKKLGIINGGFYDKTDDPATHYPSVVISVDNLKEHIKKVQKAGGKVHGEPMEIPGVGWFVAFTDTEGNRISMLQPLPR